MASPKSWELLRQRCIELVDDGDVWESTGLLNALHDGIQQAPEEKSRNNLTSIIIPVCRAVCDKWNRSNTILTGHQLETYSQASLLVSPLPPLPNLNGSWSTAVRGMREELNENENCNGVVEHYRLQRVVELATVIHKNEPRFLRQIKFPETYTSEIEQLLNLAKSEVQTVINPDSLEELLSKAERLDALADTLTSLALLVPEYRDQLQELVDEFQNQAAVLEEEARDLEGPEPDDDYDWTGDSRAKFSIESLFSDL